MTTQKRSKKRIFSNKQSVGYQKNSVDKLFVGIQEIGCDLSLMKISYNLTKRT